MKRFMLAATAALLPMLAKAQPLIGPYIDVMAGGGVLPNEKIDPAPAIDDYATRSL
jgi:hypothetical protein